MKTTLIHIANIQTGVFAKTELEGEVVYLQAKHFDEQGQLNTMLHPDLKLDKLIERHLLQPGDVLFAAKGTKNFAACYESDDLPAVASTSFFVVRIQDSYRSKILPRYLTWWLNHPNALTYLKGRARGTSIVSISKSALEELEIYIPDMQTQETILKISALRHHELQLKQQLEALREQLIQQTILNAIQ